MHRVGNELVGNRSVGAKPAPSLVEIVVMQMCFLVAELNSKDSMGGMHY